MESVPAAGPGPRPSPRRRWFRVAAVGLGALFVALACEAALHIWPALLPGWYTRTLPFHALERSAPEEWRTAPLEGFPLPAWPAPSERRLPVPADLAAFGLVAPGALERHPDSTLVLPCDEAGFPNRSRPDSADVLLVGDSFAVHAGVRSPPGLVARLEERTGGPIYNLGVLGLCPSREAWVLDRFGYVLRPRAVIWLFFGGNDIIEEGRLDRARARGLRLWHEQFPRPTSHLFAMMGQLVSAEGPAVRPLEPFALEVGGRTEPVWFSPRSTSLLAWDADVWRARAGWESTCAVLRGVAARAAREDVRLLLVYIPSKAQVSIEHLRPEPEKLHACARVLADHAGDDPEEFWQRAVRNADALEELLAAFAAAEGIDFLSLTPRLRGALAGGVPGFHAADTHWDHRGQALAVEPLADWLQEGGR